MPTVFVAKSSSLAEWGNSVGLTKHLYYLGVAAGKADAALTEMNAAAFAGQTDWKLLKKENIAGAEVETLLTRLARRERMVDPALYPRIKGVRGVFKVKMENVENHFIVKHALAGTETRDRKLKPADIGTYLILSATQ
ncbi:MAG: hypothetical protein EXQ85_10240 [Alphaproteobacteria bacterium]|nr:hypothetical protein [Alphaproteobacteria bacterium]